MTTKKMDELRAETDRLMRRSLHKTMWPDLEHQARLAALAAERNAADVEIERLTREIERLTRERDEARAEVEERDVEPIPDGKYQVNVERVELTPAQDTLVARLKGEA